MSVLDRSIRGNIESVMPATASGGGGGSDTFAWDKSTFTFSDLAVAATSLTTELVSLAAKGLIRAIVVHHTTAFSGGSISAYKINIGILGDLDLFVQNFDVFSASSGTNFENVDVAYIGSMTGATSIKIQAVSTGDNLDQAVAGSVDVYVLLSDLP